MAAQKRAVYRRRAKPKTTTSSVHKTLKTRNTKIAKAITRTTGVMCILCGELIYNREDDTAQTDKVVAHFDIAHEDYAALIAISQDTKSIDSVIREIRATKAEKKYANVMAFTRERGRVYHLPYNAIDNRNSRYSRNKYIPLCATFYYYGSEEKDSVKRKQWKAIPHAERCKTCLRLYVRGL